MKETEIEEACEKSGEKIAERYATVVVKNIKEDTVPCSVQMSETTDQKNSANPNITNFFRVQGIHHESKN